jgi:hypothetical protein
LPLKLAGLVTECYIEPWASAFYPAEMITASQEGLCPKDLITKLILFTDIYQILSIFITEYVRHGCIWERFIKQNRSFLRMG